MTEDHIWYIDVNLESVNEFARGSMIEHLGIEFTDLGPNFLTGKMPVDGRTRQPYGILHGGASVVLAETLGSMAGNLCVDPATRTAVGLDISANHIKQVVDGYVTGTARPIHLGGQTQVWEIRILNDVGDLVSTSRLTMLLLDQPQRMRTR